MLGQTNLPEKYERIFSFIMLFGWTVVWIFDKNGDFKRFVNIFMCFKKEVTTDTEKKLAAMGVNTSADYAARDDRHDQDIYDPEVEEETLPAIAPMGKVARVPSSQGSNESGEKGDNTTATVRNAWPCEYISFLLCHMFVITACKLAICISFFKKNPKNIFVRNNL